MTIDQQNCVSPSVQINFISSWVRYFGLKTVRFWDWGYSFFSFFPFLVGWDNEVSTLLTLIVSNSFFLPRPGLELQTIEQIKTDNLETCWFLYSGNVLFQINWFDALFNGYKAALNQITRIYLSDWKEFAHLGFFKAWFCPKKRSYGELT